MMGLLVGVPTSMSSTSNVSVPENRERVTSTILVPGLTLRFGSVADFGIVSRRGPLVSTSEEDCALLVMTPLTVVREGLLFCGKNEMRGTEWEK